MNAQLYSKMTSFGCIGENQRRFSNLKVVLARDECMTNGTHNIALQDLKQAVIGYITITAQEQDIPHSHG